MIRMYLRLAAKSLGQHPGLTALMVATVALGIAACVTVITIFHAVSADPIWWKSDRLYAVTLDSWDVNEPADAARPHLPPSRLTYRDAMHLFESNIPARKAAMRAMFMPCSASGMAQPRTTSSTKLALKPLVRSMAPRIAVAARSTGLVSLRDPLMARPTAVLTALATTTFRGRFMDFPFRS